MFKNIPLKINMRPKNLPSFFLGMTLFGLFLILTIVESTGFFVSIDPQVTRFLQSIIPRLADVPLSFFSILGSAEATSLILVVIFLYLFRREKVLLWSLGFFAVILFFEISSKYLIYHPGPPKYFFRYALPFATPEYLSTKYSFPSGHVSRTLFLVVVLGYLTAKRFKIQKLKAVIFLTLIVISILMCISRVYLGEHWSSDVLGGLLLGSAMGFLAMVYY